MKTVLEARRQSLLREIARVERQMVKVQQELDCIKVQMAAAAQSRDQAA
jgi:hypothetical protein